MISVTINGKACEVEEGVTLLSAATDHGVYVPTLCYHPDLPPFHDLTPVSKVFRGEHAYEHQPVADDVLRELEGCGLCVVEVEGYDEPLRACHTTVREGMSVRTESEALKSARRTSLMKILEDHPHACLTCAQREGCSLEDCSSNVPKEERCCPQFHNCELRRVAEYVGVKEETSRYRPSGLPVLDDEPLFARDFNLCIDCARCVRVCRDVRGVDALGLVHHDGRLVVGSVAPSLKDSACKFCGACVEVCPTGCLADSVDRTGEREQWLVPCSHACPAGVDVPGYIRRVAQGDLQGAKALIWQKLPLANVLGHVCFHLCEMECRRGEVDDPIAICALKRFALESGNGADLRDAVRAPDSCKKVAVIGAGPAGLSAACFLRFKGHTVTVFEAAKSAGGMPAMSIPDYRLPKEVLEKDVAIIEGLGVEIRRGSRIEPGEAMSGLLDQGFDTVLIAVGLPQSKRIAVEGSDLANVYWGLDFLRATKTGQTFDLGRKVVVIGGGNVAIDVAMTALRVSGGKVHLYCLESRQEMPAHVQEVERAEVEGVEVDVGWGPALIRGDDGRVCGVEFMRCLSVFDEQRNFAPTFDDTQRITVDADSVILAIGQTLSEDVPAEREGVFHAGDIAVRSGGGASVVDAVASGRAAAERIDKHLGGDGNLSIRLGESVPPSPHLGRDEEFVPRSRIPYPCVPPDDRCSDFRLIDGTYSPQDAVAEAGRCLQCDLRLMIAPAQLPPEAWVEFSSAAVEEVPEVDGVFILADGEKKPVAIKGSMNVKAGLLEQLESHADVRFFQWEEDPMYTKRESELIQQHLTQYGELPGGGDDELDDLF